jgi:hypothetical protein
MIEFNYLFRGIINFLRNEVSFVPKQQILITAVYTLFLKYIELEIMVL